MDTTQRLTKAHFTLKATTLKETDEGLKVIKTEKIQLRCSEFQRSLVACHNAGMPRQVELVEKEPENFQVNVVYIRIDGKYAWVWTKEDSEDTNI